MDPHATQAEDPSPRGAPLRFTYANGDKPLAGYTIKRGIGRGGFGEVYFAVSDGGKEVAIKLIRHNLDVELRGVAHCLNLKHPNLIALYDVKQDDRDNSWVVMEYATGESLEEVIRRSPQGLPPEEAVEWMQGIAAGVAYLHDHGIVHRDLKPGNIFRDDGQVKLGDYGLSKFISCSRRSGQTESIGTVHYMAPEVANGRYGKEIDIYALGIILYEMLTGHVPFEGESVGEVLMKHLTAEPSLAEVPEAYRQVIARALAKDPITRFTSVNEMIASLPPLAATMAYRPPLRPEPGAAVAGAEATSDKPAAAPQAAPPPPPVGPAFAAAAAAAAGPMRSVLGEEEPIWRAIRDGWRATRDSWDGFNTPTKVGLAVLGIMVMANSKTWSFALTYGPPLIFLYIVYRIGRSVVLHYEAKQHSAAGGTQPAAAYRAYTPPAKPAGPSPAAGERPQAAPEMQATAYRPLNGPGDWRKASERHWKRRSGKHWRQHSAAAAALVVKSPRERLADLAGSMMLAAAIGALMSLVVVLLQGGEIVKEQFAWLTITSVLGSWAVLIPSKFWEGTDGDQTLRRVTMLVCGLALGAAAYAAADSLMVTADAPQAAFSDSPRFHINRTGNLGNRFYDVKGSPQLYAYLAYFGALFAGIRWWKQADPLRRTRLSVWGTGVSVFGAWVVDAIWAFPQPWGLMVAAIISISVQLVSPYVPQHDRVARPATAE